MGSLDENALLGDRHAVELVKVNVEHLDNRPNCQRVGVVVVLLFGVRASPKSRVPVARRSASTDETAVDTGSRLSLTRTNGIGRTTTSGIRNAFRHVATETI
jgi:hypothetical protein